MEKDAILVPIGKVTFDGILKNKLYFYPQIKTNKRCIKYVFLYRVSPIQSITHYGIVEEHIDNAEDLTNLIEKMKSFKDASKIASAYKFSKIIKLKKSINHDYGSPSIQHKMYGYFNKFLRLEKTSDLFKESFKNE
jgi:hypothetical protein